MFEVVEFDSFDDCKSEWEKLEKSTFHYPFQSFWYQKLFAQAFCKNSDILIIGVKKDQNFIAFIAFERIDQSAILVGMKKVLNGQEITDFGDVLISKDHKEQTKEIWQTFFKFLKQKNMSKVQLDYVREDSQTYQALKVQSIVVEQETSPFIELSSSWEEYLESLEGKDRRELKRKIKRLEEVKFEFSTNNPTVHNFEEFIRLHKMSDIEKSSFMSDKMKDFFWEILSTEKNMWRAGICLLSIDSKQVASVFFFESDTHVLLYNSGFDPKYSYYSVGLLIHAYLIRNAISQKKKVYDFLRGKERYKYDLGAKNMPLYQLTTAI